jgi:tetratricopeptide (TPR) repeat protein
MVAFAAYANTLSFALVYDDKLILSSPLAHGPLNLENLRALFTSDYYVTPKGNVEVYRPFTNVTFVLNFLVNRCITGDGANAFGFHLVTMLLHAAASALVFVFLERLSAPRAVALSAALLFAVHPIHSEAVANVSGRAEPLAAAFGLAFLVAHRARRAVIAPIAYFCALWSKESAIAFFPIAVAMDAWIPSPAPEHAARDARRLPLRAHAVLAVVLAGWLALRAAGLRHPPSPVCFIDNPLVRVTAIERVLTAAKVQLMYLRLVAFPIGLSTDYSFDQVPLATSFADPWVLGFVALAALALIVAWRCRRNVPLASFAVCGYALSFAATSNFAFPIGTLMAERLAYTPSIFACLCACAAAWSLAAAARRVTSAVPRAVGWGLVGALAAAGFVLTWMQNRAWRDEITLFREQVRTAPKSAKAHLNLGLTLASSGELAESIREFEASLRIAPDYAWTWLWLGDAQERAGDREAAREAHERATEVEFDERARAIGVLLDHRSRSDASLELTKLVALNPKRAHESGLLQRAFLASSATERDAARAELEAARDLVHHGDAVGALGHYQRAFQSFALTQADLRSCAEELSDALHTLGKAKLAANWRALARSL